MKKIILITLLSNIAVFSFTLAGAQTIKLGVDGGISVPQLKSNGSNEIS